MKFQLSLRREAEREALAAHEYYETQEPGLGGDFTMRWPNCCVASRRIRTSIRFPRNPRTARPPCRDFLSASITACSRGRSSLSQFTIPAVIPTVGNHELDGEAVSTRCSCGTIGNPRRVFRRWRTHLASSHQPSSAAGSAGSQSGMCRSQYLAGVTAPPILPLPIPMTWPLEWCGIGNPVGRRGECQPLAIATSFQSTSSTDGAKPWA
jgi:hypothetical protein